MENRPIIGITPQHDGENGTLFVKGNYMEAVANAGGIPVLLPLQGGAEQAARFCDGFLFTGGPDPHPALYGEEMLRFCGAVDPARDEMEIRLAREAALLDKPVLGICRGLQLLNVAFGGSLYQDIAERQAGPPICHYQQRPYAMPAHPVRVEPGSLLHRLTGFDSLFVNSMHHQAVRRAAPCLRVCARSLDGLIEAAERPDLHFVLAVQWHPEYLGGAPSRGLFAALVAAAARG